MSAAPAVNGSTSTCSSTPHAMAGIALGCAPTVRRRAVALALALACVGAAVVLLMFAAPSNTARAPLVASTAFSGSGRTGNVLGAHAFWKLVAHAHGRPFVDPRGAWFAWRGGADFPSVFDLDFFAWPRRDETLRLEHRPVRTWPFDARLFVRHRAFLRDRVLRPRLGSADDVIDLAVYVRLDDISSNWYEGYTLPPLSYYERALRRARLNATAQIVVFGHCTTAAQWAMLRGVGEVVRRATGSSNVRVSGDETVDDAYRVILRSRALIAQTSTFWLMPGVASRVMNEAHLPCFGEVLKFGFFDDLDARDVLAVRERGRYRRISIVTDDAPFVVHCYDLDRSARPSAPEELARFWDVPLG